MTELAPACRAESWALAGQSPYWHGLHERLRGLRRPVRCRERYGRLWTV